MAEKTMKLPASILASKALATIKAHFGWSDSLLNSQAGIPPSLFHYHGGAGAPIAWNDVQEVDYFNRYAGLDSKIEVPSYPSVGYNQHSHTSEYDGGVLPGITGNHTHSSARNGGLCFAVLYPATGVPQADWES
jgi:hypothetical protein